MSRLIDADKLMKDIIGICKCQPSLEGRQKETVYIKDVIENQPTAYDVDKVVEQIEKQKNLIDKWEQRLEILSKEYMKNLRDKTKTKENKFNKHMKIIIRINELEMCIKDLKQLGGRECETN